METQSLQVLYKHGRNINETKSEKLNIKDSEKCNSDKAECIDDIENSSFFLYAIEALTFSCIC